MPRSSRKAALNIFVKGHVASVLRQPHPSSQSDSRRSKNVVKYDWNASSPLCSNQVSSSPVMRVRGHTSCAIDVRAWTIEATKRQRTHARHLLPSRSSWGMRADMATSLVSADPAKGVSLLPSLSPLGQSLVERVHVHAAVEPGAFDVRL